MVWETILTVNDELETRLEIEHVEDVLINQRVVYDDEWYAIYERRDKDYRPNDIYNTPTHQHANTRLDPHVKEAERMLRKMSQFNRLRRSYLLFRDWMKRRPW